MWEKATELESRKKKQEKHAIFFQGHDHKPFLQGFINLYEISVCTPIKIVTDWNEQVETDELFFLIAI